MNQDMKYELDKQTRLPLFLISYPAALRLKGAL